MTAVDIHQFLRLDFLHSVPRYYNHLSHNFLKANREKLVEVALNHWFKHIFCYFNKHTDIIISKFISNIL